MKLQIETQREDLDDEQVATLLETIAAEIRAENLTELMDGTFRIETVFGETYFSKIEA